LWPAFVTATIAFDAGPNAVNAFNIAVLRVQETGLGILVYSLISIFLWPVSTRDEFESATRELIKTQKKLYSSYLRTMTGHGTDDGINATRIQEAQIRNRCDQALFSAGSDTYEIKELHKQWQRFQGQSTALLETMTLWHASLKDVQKLDLHRLLPNLQALTTNLEPRFARIQDMLDGHAPELKPRVIDLSFDRDAVQALTHFHKAAFMVTWTQLQRIEELTRSMFDMVCELKGFGPSVPGSLKKHHAPWSGLVPDPDHILSAVSIVASILLAYLLWIYIEVPGGIGFVSQLSTWALIMAGTQMRASSLMLYLALPITFGGMLYVFIMPHLSSFVGLGIMLFVVTFAICYLFAAPSKGVVRAFSLAMFVNTIGVSNEQTYNFLTVADSLLMNVLICALLALTVYIPVSAQPEHVFLRLLGRFFHSCDYLMSTMRWDRTQKPTQLDRWKRAFHSREITTLPGKLVAWGKVIDPGTTSPDQVQALTIRLQALSLHVQELLKARNSPQASFLIDDLLTDLRDWRMHIQETFQGLQKTIGSTAAIRDRLAGTLVHLEARIEEIVNKMTDEDEISDRDAEHFYRLLGSFRTLSEATIEYAKIAEGVNWSRLRETRF